MATISRHSPYSLTEVSDFAEYYHFVIPERFIDSWRVIPEDSRTLHYVNGISAIGDVIPLVTNGIITQCWRPGDGLVALFHNVNLKPYKAGRSRKSSPNPRKAKQVSRSQAVQAILSQWLGS